MNSEITDIKNVKGWILFDAECLFCTRLARRCGPFLRRHRYALVPLQTPWVRDRLAASGNELLSEMRLLTPRGTIYGGADALIEVAKRIWWAWPLFWASRIPQVRTAMRNAYSWFARRRNCLRGACKHHSVKKRPRSKRVFFEMP